MGMMMIMFLLQVLLATNYNKVHSQPEIQFNFQSFSNANDDHLILQGDADIPQNGNGILRLVRTDSKGVPEKNSIGRVVYSTPFTFWSPGQQRNFETTIVFKITSPPSGETADGIVFFIAPAGTTIPSGSEGGNLGIFPSSGNGSNIFAVEFDIYVNGAWDPSYPHIGIDIDSRNSVATTRFEDGLDKNVIARVNYVARSRTITVEAIYGTQIPQVTYTYDLKNVLSQEVQVGISAATGTGVATFDVLSWIFQADMDNDNSVNNDNYYRRMGNNCLKMPV